MQDISYYEFIFNNEGVSDGLLMLISKLTLFT